MLSVSEHSPDILTVPEKFQTYVYYGDSLFYLSQYRKAEGIYRKALQFKKSLLKSKGTAKPQENQKELMPDIGKTSLLIKRNTFFLILASNFNIKCVCTCGLFKNVYIDKIDGVVVQVTVK